MNDRELDALIARAALAQPAPAEDPAHVPADPAATVLRGGRYELLEEIMITPTDHHGSAPGLRTELPLAAPLPESQRRRRLSTGKRVAAGLTVAAAFAAAIAVPAVVRQSNHGTVNHNVAVNDTTTAAQRAGAESGPRILLDDPSYTISSVDSFNAGQGRVLFTRGATELEVSWTAAADYQSVYHDRLDSGPVQRIEVLGQEAALFTYGGDNFAVILPVQGKSFDQITVQGADRAAFEAELAKLKMVSNQEWLAALPAPVVKPDDEAAVAEEMLAGVPLPPGFDKTTLPTGLASDYYNFGAVVTSKVACGWLDLYENARNTEDAAAMAQADRALATSKQWKVLLTMEPEGAWSDTVWQYADNVHARKAAGDYRQGLGCK